MLLWGSKLHPHCYSMNLKPFTTTEVVVDNTQPGYYGAVNCTLLVPSEYLELFQTPVKPKTTPF